MWEKFATIASSLIQISSLLVKNQKEIDDLQEQVAAIQKNVELMARDIKHFTETQRANQQHFAETARANQQRFTEMERASHRNNLLELENRILQMERRLPKQTMKKRSELECSLRFFAFKPSLQLLRGARFRGRRWDRSIWSGPVGPTARNRRRCARCNPKCRHPNSVRAP